MKVLMLAERSWPAIGGVERHCDEIARILAKRHTITVVSLAHEPSLPLVETRGGYRILRVSAPSHPFRRIVAMWLWFTTRLGLILGSDWIHCHDVNTFLWVLPFRILFPWKKFSITFHGYEGYPLLIRRIRLRRAVARLANRRINVGDFIETWYGTPADAVTFGGVNLNAEEPSMKVDREEAVFVGRLEPDSGVMLYLKALEICVRSGHRLRLTIVGDGTLRESLEHYSQEHQLPVAFVGQQPKPQKYLAGAKWACVSGYLAMLEALALGKTVLSVYDNPLKGDYLRTFPVATKILIGGSEAELANRWTAAIEDAQSEGSVSEAQAWARGQSWENVCDVYEAIWRRR